MSATTTPSPQQARQCSAGESFSSYSTNETSRGGVTPYSSSGVHFSAVHNACRVSVFIWTGSLLISAYTDGADKVKLARRARSSRSSLPVHTSREAITCLSRHRSCTATPSRAYLSPAPLVGADRHPVSRMSIEILADLPACSSRPDYPKQGMPDLVVLCLA